MQALGIMATHASSHADGQWPVGFTNPSIRATASGHGGGRERHSEMGTPVIPGAAPSRLERRAADTRAAVQVDGD
jgi:hypothetical protein